MPDDRKDDKQAVDAGFTVAVVALSWWSGRRLGHMVGRQGVTRMRRRDGMTQNDGSYETIVNYKVNRQRSSYK